MDAYEEAVLLTYGLLEERLDRLEYLLGEPAEEGETPKTIPDRISRLEKALQQLAGKSSLLKDAQHLLNKHHDVLWSVDHDVVDQPPLTTPQQAAVVVDRAPAFATVVSQLKALEDQKIPSTNAFTKLAALRPRIAEAERRQLEIMLKASALGRRNGMLNLRWIQVHFLAHHRCGQEWQRRLQKAEQKVLREEFKRKQEAEG